MKLKLIVFVVWGVLILGFSGCAMENENEEEVKIGLEEFSRCLAREGLIMFGSESCEYCKIQKEMFGSAFREISYVNCEKEIELCAKFGIEQYPSWVKDDKKYIGVKDAVQLSKISGCKVPNI